VSKGFFWGGRGDENWLHRAQAGLRSVVEKLGGGKVNKMLTDACGGEFVNRVGDITWAGFQDKIENGLD